MRIFSPAALAALESGRFTTRSFVKIAPAGEVPLCFWDDIGAYSYGGNTYEGKAGRFTIEATVSASDLGAHGVAIEFSAVDTDAIAMIDGVAWHQCPVLIYRAVIAIDTPQTLQIEPEFSGFLDTIVWNERGGGTASLVLNCESASRELSRSGARTSADADQRQRDPDDGIFSFTASAVNTSIDWGRSPEQGQPRKAGIAAIWDKIF